jgi:hypothetical protein
MTTSIQDYLDTGIVSFAFPKIDTYTNKRGVVKKKPIKMPNWKTINKENCLKYSVGNAYAVVTGKQSNLTIVDFDVKDDNYKSMEKHPKIKTYKTIQTNKGFFICYQYDPDFQTTVDAFREYKGVDIRNDAGIVFCPPTTYYMPNGDIIKYIDLSGTFELPPTYLKSYIKTTDQKVEQNVEQKNKPKVQPKVKTEHTKNEVVNKLLYHNP